MARSGDTLYVCGNFLTMGRSTGSGLTVTPGTGQSIRPFPQVAGTVVKAIPDGHRGWFIAGSFQAVGGVSRHNVAHVLADGSLAAWCADANGTVAGLALDGTTLYLSGEFTAVRGEPRQYLASVSAESGRLTNWRPDPDNLVQTLSSRNGVLYVGGNFTTIGDSARSCLAAFDTKSGRATAWNPSANNEVDAITSGDTVIYIGGRFTSIGGE